MLPVFGRIYSRYRGWAYNGVFTIIPAFWVGIVDGRGANKSEALGAFSTILQDKDFENFDIPESEDEKMPEQYVFNSASPEGLVNALKDNECGVYLYSDELATFIDSIGKYSKGGKGGEDSFWLQMFNGKPHVDARVTVKGGRRRMKRQVISVGGTIQRNVMNEKFDEKLLQSGFFDRILWSVANDGFKRSRRSLDYSIDGAIAEIVDKHIEYANSNSGFSASKSLRYSNEALEYLHDWEDGQVEILEKLGPDTVEASFFSKRQIYINRFALLCEILWSKGEATNISAQSALLAIEVDKWVVNMWQMAIDLAYPKTDFEDMLTTVDDRSLAEFLIRRYNCKQVDVANVMGVTPGRITQILKY
jgi:hypothetical protein